MTTSIMPEIICLDASILTSSLCSNETSSLIAFKKIVNKNCQRNQLSVKPKTTLSKSFANQEEKEMKKNSNSAPVSVVNTPDWHKRRKFMGEKQRLNVLQSYGIKKISSNSSESSYLALNHSINSNNNAGNNNRSSHNNSIAKSEDSKLKTCCLCWCCCYTFSCLNVNSSSEDSSKNQISNNLTSRIETIINEERLTLELVKKWAESFDTLLQCSGHKIFREFLKSEYSEENILFYLACEDLKKEKVPDIVEEKARFIYEDYISILSPKEVSLDSRVREIINDNMVEPTSCTFDEAQLQIYTLMHRDSYPRFLNSKLYKDLLLKLEYDILK